MAVNHVRMRYDPSTRVEVELDGIQIHSAAESMLGKRKRSISYPEQTMFDIVTTGRSWPFIRWNGTLKSPKAEITQEYPFIFEGEMKEAKTVNSYIVRILQSQAKSLNKEGHVLNNYATIISLD
ncbi:5124_t:CDS:2, partial [Funneliformis geosporum]